MRLLINAGSACFAGKWTLEQDASLSEEGEDIAGKGSAKRKRPGRSMGPAPKRQATGECRPLCYFQRAEVHHDVCSRVYNLYASCILSGCKVPSDWTSDIVLITNAACANINDGYCMCTIML